MKIRKTLVVCPESRRSEIVAVLFPSSTSFPETKTLKRIKKENMPGISRLQVFLSRNVQTFPQWSFWEGCKNIARIFVLRSPSACSSLYLSKLNLLKKLFYISDGMQEGGREHCQDVCLQVTLCSSLYSSCFKGKWDLSQDWIWQKNEDKVTLAHFLKFIWFHSSMNFSIYLVSQTDCCLVGRYDCVHFCYVARIFDCQPEILPTWRDFYICYIYLIIVKYLWYLQTFDRKSLKSDRKYIWSVTELISKIDFEADFLTQSRKLGTRICSHFMNIKIWRRRKTLWCRWRNLCW